MLEVDLSQLLGGKSFTIPCTLFRNGYRVTTTTLANSRANAFALLNTKCAKNISKFLNTPIEILEKPILVKGYNKQMGTPITSVLQTHFQINRRQQYNMPFLITDLGSHDAILSREWLAYLNLQLDVWNRRLIQPNDLLLTPMFVKETTINIRTLQCPTINMAYQANVNYRDQAFQEELQSRKIQVLRRT